MHCLADRTRSTFTICVAVRKPQLSYTDGNKLSSSVISGFRRDADKPALITQRRVVKDAYHSTLRYALEERRSQTQQFASNSR
jgi:hypothetical protein